jgi:glycerol kinase
MAAPLILAIDQGTSSTKCLLVDAAGGVVARAQADIGQATPKPGWVEQDAGAIWQSVRRAIADVLDAETARRVATIGISNQRESCLIWDRRTGAPLTPVLSWQDQRTETLCAGWREQGHAATVRRISGLPLDPMFSAAKLSWLLDEIDPDRTRASAGEFCAGTVDSYLLARLGAGHVIEAGNASRLQLVDVAANRYSDELLAIFDIPEAILPRIVRSAGGFCRTAGLSPLPDGLPISAVMADSHAALFAHGAFAPGPVKATHGTGASIMGLLDREQVNDGARLHPGVCLTVAWWIDSPMLAFEGNIRSAGSTLLWAADLLGIDAAELARLAATVADCGAVQLIPAFGGLGAPWWDAGAVATLSGMSLGPSRAVVARAALDSIAHQIADVVDAVRSSQVAVERLHVDGGPTRNDQLMQFEADMVACPVARTDIAELSALGVAHLAGYSGGLFTLTQLAALDRGGEVFVPGADAPARRAKRGAWQQALARTRSAASPGDRP